LKTRFEKFVQQLKYLPPTFRIVWNASHHWTVIWVSILVVLGVLPGASVYLTRVLVDSAVAAIDNGGSPETIWPLIMWALVMGVVMLLSQLLGNVLKWVRLVQSELLQDYATNLIHDKSIEVDLAFYETSDYFDSLHRAQGQAAAQSLQLLNTIGNLLQNVITLTAMGTILISFGLWVPVLLFIGALPVFFVVVHFNNRHHAWWEQTTSDRRWTTYFNSALTDSQIAQEVRLFETGSYFQRAYQRLRQRLRTERIDLGRRQMVAELFAGSSSVILPGLIMAWMVWQAVQGQATLGDLAMFYQAINRAQGLLGSLLGGLSQMYTNTLFLGNLFQFLGIEPQVVSPPEPTPLPAEIKQGISLKNVSFHYPGTDRLAIENFNLDFPAGKITAIVGPNGAGKSTLMKLMCRFYDPQAGRVELDGVDLRDYPLVELRRRFSTMFQFPSRYQATARENIGIGHLPSMSDMEAVEKAARSADVHKVIDRLPKKYETLLGKWFEGGTELSGGEWQRVALARAFLREADIFILDEPTSAMDSWAENEWLGNFREQVRGHTAIVITHRFTTAMRADLIYVMDEGRVMEAGTHNELLALNGRYADSWYAQVNSASGPQARSAQPELIFEPAVEASNVVPPTVSSNGQPGDH
jgi:ATP-binding cassette subfamily B protein